MTERLVVDTNVLMSGLLTPNGKTSLVVWHVLDNYILLQSDDTLAEIHKILARPYFQDRIPPDVIQAFLDRLATQKIDITHNTTICRDPTDNKFLELAVSGNAHMIVTGAQPLPTGSR